MHRVLLSARMLASGASFKHSLSANAQHVCSHSALARPAPVLQLNSRSQHQLQRSRQQRRVHAAGLSEDLDSLLITRQAFSSLEAPARPQQRGSGPASKASTSASPSRTDSQPPTLADVQAHKRAAVQQAYINNSLGFGFSAGGLVFPYYVGLVSSLVQHGVLTRPAQLAGSSAGSLIAASFNAGLDMETVERSMIQFGEDCLKNGTRYRLGPLLREFLHTYLPPDAHQLCSGTTHVAVTRLLPYWRTQMVSHFESRDDLIAALLTSCHIPWYFDGRWMTKFRGHYCVDGGVMAFIPTVPEADYTVKVLCFPSSHLSAIKGATANSRPLQQLHSLVDIDITMDSFEDWPYDLPQVLKWAVLASAQETSSLLIEKGKRDGTAWFKSMELQPLVDARRAEQQTLQQGLQARQQQQQQQQGEGAVILPSDSTTSSSSSSTGSNVASPSEQEVGSDWADDKPSQQRQQDAQQAEAAAAKAQGTEGMGDIAHADGDRNGDGANGSTGGDNRAAAAKHAAAIEAAGLSEPPNKRHKAATAAAMAAAAAGAVKEGVASVFGQGGSKRE